MRLFQSVLAVIIVAATAAMAVLIVVYIGLDDDPHPPPYGCAWLDMAPGKSADFRLACVPGYFP